MSYGRTYPDDPQLIEQMNEEQLQRPMENRPNLPIYEQIMRELWEQDQRRERGHQPQNDGLAGYRGFGNVARNVASAFLPGFQYGTPPGYVHRGRGVVGEHGPEVVEGEYTVVPLDPVNTPEHARDPAAMSSPAQQPPPPQPPQLSPAQAELQAHIEQGRPTPPEAGPLKRILAGVAQGLPAGLSGLSRVKRGGYGGRGGGFVGGFMEGMTNPTPLWAPGHYQKVQDYDSRMADLQAQAEAESQVAGEARDEEKLGLDRERADAYIAAQRAAEARANRPPTTRQLAPAMPNTPNELRAWQLQREIESGDPERAAAAQEELRKLTDPKSGGAGESVTASERQRAIALHQSDQEKYPTWQDALPDARANMGSAAAAYERKRLQPKAGPTLTPQEETVITARRDAALKRIDDQIQRELDDLEKAEQTSLATVGKSSIDELSPFQRTTLMRSAPKRLDIISKYAEKAQQIEEQHRKALSSHDKAERETFDRYGEVMEKWKARIEQKQPQVIPPRTDEQGDLLPADNDPLGIR